MQFRRFQTWLHERFADVAGGMHGITVPEEVILDVGCGAGKSVAVLIVAHWLIERLRVVDRVIWVVPNGPLRRQAARACGPDEVAARLLGHRLEIVEATNEGNPAKGRSGYAVTYAALAAARNRAGEGRSNPHVDELARHRYALILDEPHHLVASGGDQVERGYTRGVEPLIQLARVRVFMSGTLFRHDRRPIAFMPYAEGKIVTEETETRWFRKYSLQEAIEDRAVIKTEFYLSDGRASWLYAGQPFDTESLDEHASALLVALQTQFAQQLLEDTVRHWQAWRERHIRSKLLVVCADTKQASRAVKALEALRVRADIATYKEDNADETIERFKGNGLHALVTVNKAYEGLDVPQITHIACLTHIRSIPWINQMLARAWRFDSKGDPYEEQAAFVFAPADSLFREVVDRIWDAFQHRVFEPSERPTDGGGDDPANGSDEPRPVITPRDSDKTVTIGQVLGGEIWRAEEMSELVRIQDRLMVRGFAPVPLDCLATIVEEARAERAVPVGVAAPSGGAYRTPGERIELLRRDLANNVGVAAAIMARETGLGVGDCATEINRQIMIRWRKRGLMEEDELQAAIAWIRGYYGIE